MKILEYENFVFYSPDGKVYFAAGALLDPNVYQIGKELKENEKLLYTSRPIKQWFFIIHNNEREFVFHGEGEKDIIEFIKNARDMVNYIRQHLTEEDRTIRVELRGAVLHCTSNFRIIYIPLTDQRIPMNITYNARG